MGLLLLLCLCFMTFVAFELSNKDIISPWFITCLSFFASTFFLILVAPNWGIKIQSNTVWVILCAVAFFGVGEVLAQTLWNRGGYKSVRYFGSEKSYIPIGLIKYGLALAFETAILLLYIYKSVVLVKSQFVTSGLSEMMTYLRFLLIHTDASLGLLGIMCYYLGFSFSLVAAFILINNLLVIRKWEKKDLLLVAMILEGVVFLFFSASRYVFIIYLVAVAIIYINRLRATGSTRKIVNSKGMKYAAVLGVLGLSLFFVLGLFVGKNTSNAFDAVAAYVASPIAALNEFMKGNVQGSQEWGGETLLGIRNLLNRFGFDVQTQSRMLDFIEFGNGYTTNVYTSLRRYLNDFGVVGMCIVQMMFGFVFSLLYMVSFNKKKSVFIILYAYLNYKLVLQFFDEEFLSTFFSIDEILSIICLVAVYYAFCYPIVFRRFKQVRQ